jgi:hypothetical protein
MICISVSRYVSRKKVLSNRMRIYTYIFEWFLPNAGEPVCDKSKSGHEEQENCGAVLWISVDFASNPHQSEQSGGLQEPNQSCGLQTTNHVYILLFSIYQSASFCVSYSNPPENCLTQVRQRQDPILVCPL